MAQANSYRMEKGGFFFAKKCEHCDEKPTYRAFYYPTYMNGDAEWLGDFCEQHKDVNLKKLPFKND